MCTEKRKRPAHGAATSEGQEEAKKKAKHSSSNVQSPDTAAETPTQVACLCVCGARSNIWPHEGDAETVLDCIMCKHTIPPLRRPLTQVCTRHGPPDARKPARLLGKRLNLDKRCTFWKRRTFGFLLFAFVVECESGNVI